MQFNTLNNALARCPHCRKISSVGPDFARGRGIAFIIVGIIALVIAIAVTVSQIIIYLSPFNEDKFGLYSQPSDILTIFGR